ncbi:3-oxo-tetronate 4-phosphate decarboxylase [Rhizobium bangladeshense]|uniref:3-oxo-tetronate 4-phosphate decarboxylase n=1 Tax=Rhizobium bangladeshense TaxID=1138189 RepID=UPI001C830C1C|nr:3-oxo-tetronate 4-phosphate decarboxylase [Rhizobium bangladeshense]MBX4901202.1 aldolase [Rhizobium bangladeshense]MBX4915290.1 aldolase [Rhizobium bangladeshense]MBX4922206.1 aldolase [Rhizobium bangladeshense]MBY3599407.1 aldolase [Rhizobium bangladeshense]
MTATISEETKVRDEIVDVGKSLFDRGLTAGSTGNISVRLSDGRMLMTPTNASLGGLDPARLSCFSADGVHESGDKPTKEAFLHRCMYCGMDGRRAVVHLHSTYSVAVSILRHVNERDVMPPLTAYYVMRVGVLPLVPYFPPGDQALAAAVGAAAADHHAVLMANHGPVVAGKTLRDAQYATEELEETAKLFMLLQNHEIRPLTHEQRAALIDLSK